MQKGRCLPPCQLRATAFGIRIIESFFFFLGGKGKGGFSGGFVDGH